MKRKERREKKAKERTESDGNFPLLSFAFRSFFFFPLLSVLSVSAAPSPYAAIDSAYFHRDQGRNLDLSLSEIEAGLSRNPSDAGLLWREGRSLARRAEQGQSPKEKLDRLGEARSALEKSLKINSRSADAHYWLGVVLGRIGQTRGILRSLFLLSPLRREMDAALALDPRYEPAVHVQGEIYFELPGFVGGSALKAAQKFERARDMNPDDLVNGLSLAKAYLRLGRKKEAAAAIEEALGVKNPADPGEYQDNVKDLRALLRSAAANR